MFWVIDLKIMNKKKLIVKTININTTCVKNKEGKMQENKPRKRNNASLIAIITLSILLVGTLAIGVTGAFFGATNNAGGDITLGDPVNINITQGGASATALTFAGTAMPGTVYDQTIGVTTPTNTSDCVVRAKITITNNDGASTNVTAEVNATDWQTGDDDYYYYKGTMSSGDSVGFVNSVTIPKTLTNLDANKTYTITVVVEAIQYANGAASETWTTAPEDWVNSYGVGA